MRCHPLQVRSPRWAAACGLGLLVLAAGCGAAPSDPPPAVPADLPPLLSGIGTSKLKIQTTSPLAQQYFDQGLNLLHCFWDYEALRAFRTVVRLDPQAAMGYWGLYLSLNYNQREELSERQSALAAMRRLSAQASDREQRYLRAVLRLNDAGVGSAGASTGGQAAFIDEMEQLIAAYPEEFEAKLFLVKFLITESGGYFTNPDDPNRQNKRTAFDRAFAILRPLLASHGESAAVHHYWIHVHEYSPHPEGALASAAKLPSLAPNSGHILHMPGHIYYQVGEYEKAYQAFHQSLAFDQAYVQSHGLAPVDNWNYVHNLDYLVANCAEDGRYREGQKWATQLLDLESSPHRVHAVGRGFVIWGGRSALARLHFRYGNWSAAAVSLHQVLERGDPHRDELAAAYLRGLAVFAGGMAALEGGQLDLARQALQGLLRMSLELRDQHSDQGGDWYFDAGRRILTIATFELAGSLASLEGQHEAAVAQLERAVEMEASLGYFEPPHYSRPVHQSLARALLRAGRPDAARQVYERELERRPNNGHAWFGIAQAQVAAGQVSAARTAFRRFLAVWSHADPDLPQVRAAQDWLSTHPD